jgi:hypothetical protein
MRDGRRSRQRTLLAVGCLAIAVGLAVLASVALGPGRALAPTAEQRWTTPTGPASPSPPPNHTPSAASSPPAGLAPTPSAAASRSGPGVVPAGGTGRFDTVPGGSGRVGASGRLLRYLVQVEVGTGQRPDEFAAAVEHTLADSRSWIAGGRWSFQRVPAGPSDFTVHLATPTTTERMCARAGLYSGGEYSCRTGRDVVINLKRWLLGVPWYADALDEYRHMVLNHEIGHFLGHGHVSCSGAGRLAPVMQQQTKGLQGCRRNAWPYPDGRTYVG